MILQATPQDYHELLNVWEVSVRSTHHFLTEENIQFYKPLVKEQYFPAVELYIIRNQEGKIAAFMGLSEELVEMLFVHPDEQGKGYGKQLMEYAIHQKHIYKVDVNEQNEQACGFYQHLGFQVIGHDATDPTGNPFPILHLQREYAPEIRTRRLLLRPFNGNDLPEFFECCHNPNLGNNAGWKPHDTIEESKEFLHAVFINQENMWAIVDNATTRLIGSIGLIPDPKRENAKARMIGYWLKESHWGQGLMTEAVQAVLKYGFRTLGLDLITANCYPFNLRSQRVLKRQGFIYEGILHQAEEIYTGEVYDHLCYYIEPNSSSTVGTENSKPASSKREG